MGKSGALLLRPLCALATVFALLMPIERVAATEPYGMWVPAHATSCELACRARRAKAFVAGQYNDNGGDYTICRAPYGRSGVPADDADAGRPGFQHQKGSPNVCKIQSRSQINDFDCLCVAPTAIRN